MLPGAVDQALRLPADEAAAHLLDRRQRRSFTQAPGEHPRVTAHPLRPVDAGTRRAHELGEREGQAGFGDVAQVGELLEAILAVVLAEPRGAHPAERSERDGVGEPPVIARDTTGTGAGNEILEIGVALSIPRGYER